MPEGAFLLMVTAFFEETDIEMLKNRLADLLHSGYKKSGAYKLIASEYQVSFSTIYRSFQPIQRLKNYEYSKKYFLRPEIKRKRATYLRNYRGSKDYKDYDRKYRWVRRNLAGFLLTYFEDQHTFSCDDIRNVVLSEFDFKIRSSTIEKLLKKYRHEGKLGSLDEIEPDLYRLKPDG